MAGLRNSKKWFLTIEAVIVAVVLALAVILLLEKNREKNYKISVIVQDSDSSQWSAFKYGLKKAAEDQKVEMTMVSTGESVTAEEAMHTIHSEIENGMDALILQPIPGADMEGMLKKIKKKVPVMFVDMAAEEAAKIPCTQPDHYAMGVSLAKELAEDYNGNIEKKTIGIVAQTNQSEAVIKRDKGFKDTLAGLGAEVCWSISLAQDLYVKDQAKVDFIIALDDRSLVAAGKDAAANNLHGALLYGIGNSTEAVYYLDTGTVQCLVVPDEFNMGYQSLTQAAEHLSHPFSEMHNMAVNYTAIRREELFSRKNQELIFTMSQ